MQSEMKPDLTFASFFVSFLETCVLSAKSVNTVRFNFVPKKTSGQFGQLHRGKASQGQVRPLVYYSQLNCLRVHSGCTEY